MTSTATSPLASMVTVSTIAIGAAAALVAIKMFSRTKKSDESSFSLPTPPIGSKFLTLPTSRITMRYIDTDTNDTDADTNSNTIANTKKKQVTFVLLHGFAGVLETWEHFTPFLVDRNNNDHNNNNVRVVALDLVGSGFSDKPIGDDFDYSYRRQGEIVSEFISALDLSNVVLIGHSSGANIAAATAVHNVTVVGAVFIASALFRSKSDFFSKSWLKPLFKWIIGMTTTDRRKGLARMHLPIHAERVLTDEFVHKFSAPTLLPNYSEALIKTVMAKEAPYEELIDQLLLISSPSSSSHSNINPATDSLTDTARSNSNKNRTTFPMLFVAGRQDTYSRDFVKHKEIIRQKLEAASISMSMQQQIVQMKELESCHHYPQHEQPQALAEEILAWLPTNA